MTAVEHAGADPLTRELVTPEGVDLRVTLASAGQRAGAFLIDAVLIVGVLVALSLACLALGVATRGASLKVIGVVWLFGFFALRNGWFLAFELGARAATPGKRLLKLRVISRNGGRLSADAAFARNALREIEVFLPLTFLAMNAQGLDGWILLMGLVWSGGFLLFPLFNRDRLRVGDLVAGTWVVRTPRPRLQSDLTQTRMAAAPARFAFTPAQIDAYGIRELQVLEDVLRRNSRTTTAAVAERIRAKIGWAQRPDESDGEFLEAYYAALRTRLESKLLLGRRRRDKHDAA